MSTTHTIVGLGGLAVAAQVAISSLLPNSFMDVQRMEYDGHVVRFERVVFDPATVADWTASVFSPGENDPVCSGHGWSEYTPDEPTEKVFTLDRFVNDDGCAARLLPGVEHRLYLFWVPRDGRRAVSASSVFTAR